MSFCKSFPIIEAFLSSISQPSPVLVVVESRNGVECILFSALLKSRRPYDVL